MSEKLLELLGQAAAAVAAVAVAWISEAMDLIYLLCAIQERCSNRGSSVLL